MPDAHAKRAGVVLLLLAAFFLLAVTLVVAGCEDRDGVAMAKEGCRSLQVGLTSWSVDNGDLYPDNCDRATLGAHLHSWPANPYTGRPMTEGTGPGDLAYTVSADGASYTLVGYGEDGQAVIALP